MASSSDRGPPIRGGIASVRMEMSDEEVVMAIEEALSNTGLEILRVEARKRNLLRCLLGALSIPGSKRNGEI